MEALHSLHDYPKAQEAASTARQEIALNGTYLRDVILSEFGSVSPDHLLEATDVNANRPARIGMRKYVIRDVSRSTVYRSTLVFLP